MVGIKKAGGRDGGKLHRLCRHEEHARRTQRSEGSKSGHQSLAQISRTIGGHPACKASYGLPCPREMAYAIGGRALLKGRPAHATARPVHSDRLVHRLQVEQHLRVALGHDRFQVWGNETTGRWSYREPQADAAGANRRPADCTSGALEADRRSVTDKDQCQAPRGRRTPFGAMPIRRPLATQAGHEIAEVMAGGGRGCRTWRRRNTARFTALSRHAFDEGWRLNLGYGQVARDDCRDGGKSIRAPSSRLADGCRSGTLDYHSVTKDQSKMQKDLILLVGAKGFEPSTPSLPDTNAKLNLLMFLRFSKSSAMNAARTSGRWITEKLPGGFNASSEERRDVQRAIYAGRPLLRDAPGLLHLFGRHDENRDGAKCPAKNGRNPDWNSFQSPDCLSDPRRAIDRKIHALSVFGTPRTWGMVPIWRQLKAGAAASGSAGAFGMASSGRGASSGLGQVGSRSPENYLTQLFRASFCTAALKPEVQP
jgi:hypothetical protein